METTVTVCDICLSDGKCRVAVGYYFDDQDHRHDICAGHSRILQSGGTYTIAFYRYPGNEGMGRWLDHPAIPLTHIAGDGARPLQMYDGTPDNRGVVTLDATANLPRA